MDTPSRPRRSTEISKWDHETDVLVVGLGCAGAGAALEAAAAGVQVTLAERFSGGGGTTAQSGGVIYMGGGTPLQKACGFEDSPEEMFKYLMASCGAAVNEEKVRAFCADSVEHYHWFTGNGVPFKAVFYPHYSGEPPTDDGLVYSGSEDAWPTNEIARPAPRGHVPQIPGKAGGLIMQKLVAAVERSPVELMYDTRARTLVVTPDGEVVGAVMKCAGQELLVRARRGVVLGTGGFIMNEEMIATHCPQLARCEFKVGTDGDDGSGIRMGAGAGGLAINMGMGEISLPIIPPRSLQKGILINRYGQRFINEDSYYGRLGDAVLFHQEGVAYLIVDEKLDERPEVPRDFAAVGEDAAELERNLALPAGSLAATLDLYNHHARRGRDPMFRKAPQWIQPLKPPYGAYDCRVDSSFYAAFTLGGLRTTVDSEVLTPDGEVIPGLYAAGRTSAGLAAPGYSSGISIGDGSYFGRRAGRAAAKRS